MNIKTTIKNNLWHVNYIIPFAKKHRHDEKGIISLSRDVIQSFRDIKPVRSKGSRSVGSDAEELFKSAEIEIDRDSQFVYSLDTHKTIAVRGNIISNFTIDYRRIIDDSFDHLAASAMAVDDEYGKEAKKIYNAVHTLGRRTVEAIADSNLQSDDKKRKQEYFQRMFHEPARHFDEALQRILFFNQIMWQTRHRLNGLGRLDHILEDYYKNDIESGFLTRQTAEDLVDDFLLQLSKYSDYKSDALKGDIGQIIILGGLNQDGSYFSNELTTIFLKAQARSRKIDPKTLLRVSGKMPDEVLKTAIECLQYRTGSPLFSNDDIVIPSLKSFGMPDEDAYSYCTSACWEPFIVGKSLDQNNVAVFDCFSALDTVLNSGLTEEDIDFESLLKEYALQNLKNFRSFLRGIDTLEWAKDPLVSLFTDRCSELRKDISEGGAVYNNYGITTIGMGSVIDSLFNIKKLVYEDHVYSLTELNSMRQHDFKDHEDVYKSISSMRKHYAHDDEDVIAMVNRVTRSMAKTAERYRNKLGGTVKFGLSSPGYNIEGKNAATDVAGRKKGMPYSPHISCSDASYTEVVGFASSLKYDRQRFNGNVVDFFISPDFIKNNFEKFFVFLKGAVKSGFFQMQMNVMDSKTLIDAKKHPEKYSGLIVRVWGFSAYFNELPESYKDLMIERALQAERLEAA